MHESVEGWIRWKVGEYNLTGKTVLELGSRNVNGSVRELFGAMSYVGIDIEDGNGVDIVADANSLPFQPGSFDIVVCTEMLEHDLMFWRSIKECFRVLMPKGHLLLTTRGIGFPEHNFPSDYYRFTTKGIEGLLFLAGFQIMMVEEDSQYPGVFAHATRS